MPIACLFGLIDPSIGSPTWAPAAIATRDSTYCVVCLLQPAIGHLNSTHVARGFPKFIPLCSPF